MNVSRRNFLQCLGAGLAASAASTTLGVNVVNSPKAPRNIVLILADDLGWGDVSCYGSTPGLTPFIDEFVKSGVRFTDAHSPASTCTPTRYAILTGGYAWRHAGTGIAPGDAGLLIPTNITTLPKIMQRSGRRTAAIGKWHLGMGPGPGKTDWNKPITPSANDVGFDETFLMAATADRTPCVYVKNGTVVGLDPADPIEVNYKHNYPGEPDGVKDRASLKMDWSHGHNQAVINGIGRIGYMKGGEKARWIDEDMADVFVSEAQAFIERNKNTPFFLYFATNDIHVPRVPHPRFVGSTPFGPRGDATRQFDDSVRRVIETLDRLGLKEETLVVITSDNGPFVDDGYRDQSVEKLGAHKPAGPWRGTKYTPYEGGHRLPFIVRWPTVLKGGVDCDGLISLVDLASTFAAICGQPLTHQDFPDSFDQSALLRDPTRPSVRDSLICQDWQINYRKGDWKYIVPQAARNNPTVKNDALNGQLYNLKDDPHETRNLVKDKPELAKEMFNALLDAAKNGRTRP